MQPIEEKGLQRLIVAKHLPLTNSYAAIEEKGLQRLVDAKHLPLYAVKAHHQPVFLSRYHLTTLPTKAKELITCPCGKHFPALFQPGNSRFRGTYFKQTTLNQIDIESYNSMSNAICGS